MEQAKSAAKHTPGHAVDGLPASRMWVVAGSFGLEFFTDLEEACKYGMVTRSEVARLFTKEDLENYAAEQVAKATGSAA